MSIHEDYAPLAGGPVPLIDVVRQYGPLSREIGAAIESVCHSGRFVLGPECERLEKAIAEYCQTAHAVGCASGSDALLLALMAAGVGAGDEVLLPSYTFFATASAIVRLGAVPVFVDIQRDSFNLDVRHLAACTTAAAKAVIPVHLYGQAADMSEICRFAAGHDLTVVEDAAQAIGARYGKRPVGALGDVACFSFYPTKNLGGFGDGGMLTTDRDDLADRLRLLRAHGMRPRYHHSSIGINSRLDSIQAAVLNTKLPHLDRWTTARRENASRYTKLFAEAELADVMTLPVEGPGQYHSWNQYVIRVSGGRRDALREYLTEQQIGTEIYYPVPLHQQPCFAGMVPHHMALPETDRAARETLALPIFPELTAAEQATVVDRVAQFFSSSAGRARRIIPRPKHLDHLRRCDAPSDQSPGSRAA